MATKVISLGPLPVGEKVIFFGFTPLTKTECLALDKRTYAQHFPAVVMDYQPGDQRGEVGNLFKHAQMLDQHFETREFGDFLEGVITHAMGRLRVDLQGHPKFEELYGLTPSVGHDLLGTFGYNLANSNDSRDATKARKYREQAIEDYRAARREGLVLDVLNERIGELEAKLK